MKACLFSNQCSVLENTSTILWKVSRMRNLHRHIQENYGVKYGIQTYFKGNKTLRQVLVKPKDQASKEEEECDNILLPV